MEQPLEKPITNFETYSVDTNGVIRCLRSGKEIPQHLDGNGYKTVNVRNPNGYKTLRVHRIVGETFLPYVENKSEIDHIDRNKLNNNLSNLRWANDEEQSMNRKGYGQYPKYIFFEKAGSKNYASYCIQIHNHMIKLKKGFRSDKYTIDEVIEYRNNILTMNNIPIID